MMLAEPLFACVAGIAAAALVIVTAPLWTAAASRLSQWMISLVTRASKTVDESIYGDQDIDKDKHKDKGDTE